MIARMKVAMLAPPWLHLPPRGYGGIEYLVHYLVIELRKLGVEVELFATGGSTTPADQTRWLYGNEQYPHIARPLYESVPVPSAHIMFALSRIAGRDFDLIHDHNGFLGPLSMAFLDPARFPPVLHTLHGPFEGSDERPDAPDNRAFYAQLARCDNVFVNGISHAQMRQAPPNLAIRSIGVVHNAIDVDDYPFAAEKGESFLTLARVCRDKGQGVAARACAELGCDLTIAGSVAGLWDPVEVVACAGALDRYPNPDLRYFARDVLPHLEPGRIEYVGNVSGAEKLRLIARARALLFPIDWEEPFGLAVIESLACGTPVIAMARGALPEIVEHGVNGFLANDERDFAACMQRVDEIDPAACRATVEERFSASVMAARYLEAYGSVIERPQPPEPPPARAPYPALRARP